MGLLDDIGSGLSRVGNKISKEVSNATSQAQQWMQDRANDARDTISGGYSRIAHEAVNKLVDSSPEVLKGAVSTLGHGYADIGTKVVDFLDPVSYALETGADLIDMAVSSPGRRIDAIKRIAQGDIAGGATDLGKEFLDETLLKAQVGLAALPGGSVAGKAARKPLKVARKAMKSELKTVGKETAEGKALKKEIRKNKLKTRMGVPMAKTSGIVAKAKGKEMVHNARSNLNIDKRKLHAPQRDVNALTSQIDFLEPFTREGDVKWNKEKQRRK